MDPNEQTTLEQGNPELTEPKKENVLLGIIGALLLSLAGGAMVFLFMQINIIAGLAGIVGFIATYWGYRKFSGSDGSKLGVIISLIFTLISLVAGLYISYAAELAKTFETSLGDAIPFLKEYLANSSELRGEFIKNLLILLGLTAVASISTIVSSFKKTN